MDADLVAEFSGGPITSDGGVILLRGVDRQRRLVERLAACFEDYREYSRIEHSVEDLLRQRLYGLALGYDTSMTTRSSARMCSWLPSSIKPTPQALSAAASGIVAMPWRARAR